jgi:hypothetical protein
MSTNNSDLVQDARREAAANDEGDVRRDETISRLRSALMHDRLSVMALTDENTGTDPYNSGVHRALAKAHVWRKGSR